MRIEEVIMKGEYKRKEWLMWIWYLNSPDEEIKGLGRMVSAHPFLCRKVPIEFSSNHCKPTTWQKSIRKRRKRILPWGEGRKRKQKTYRSDSCEISVIFLGNSNGEREEEERDSANLTVLNAWFFRVWRREREMRTNGSTKWKCVLFLSFYFHSTLLSRLHAPPSLPSVPRPFLEYNLFQFSYF